MLGHYHGVRTLTGLHVEFLCKDLRMMKRGHEWIYALNVTHCVGRSPEQSFAPALRSTMQANAFVEEIRSNPLCKPKQTPSQRFPRLSHCHWTSWGSCRRRRCLSGRPLHGRRGGREPGEELANHPLVLASDANLFRRLAHLQKGPAKGRKWTSRFKESGEGHCHNGLLRIP